MTKHERYQGTKDEILDGVGDDETVQASITQTMVSKLIQFFKSIFKRKDKAKKAKSRPTPPKSTISEPITNWDAARFGDTYNQLCGGR